MENCFDNKVNNYKLNQEKEDLHNHIKHLDHFDCCNEKSCDDLAYEYENVINKCHDVYSKVGILNVNEKGRISEQSLCTMLEEKQNKIFKKINNLYERKGGKKSKNKRINTNKKNKRINKTKSKKQK